LPFLSGLPQPFYSPVGVFQAAIIDFVSRRNIYLHPLVAFDNGIGLVAAGWYHAQINQDSFRKIQQRIFCKICSCHCFRPHSLRLDFKKKLMLLVCSAGKKEPVF